MFSKDYSLEFPHDLGDGMILFDVQQITNDHGVTSYVLKENADNLGPHVANIAEAFGDAVVAQRLEDDPQFKPESLLFFVERPERDADNEPRFAQWTAQTTKLDNVSHIDNVYEPKVEEWRWNDGYRMDKPELEERLGAEVPTAMKFQDQTPAEQNKEFREARLPEEQPYQTHEQSQEMDR